METPSPTKRSKLLELVFFKWDQILREYEQVLDADCVKWHKWHELLENENSDTVDEWVSTLVACTLEGASEIDRRIGGLVRTYPLRLAWLIFTKDPLKVCRKRQDLASELISENCDYDQSFTAKLVAFFRPELEHCASTGMLDQLMHQCVSDFFEVSCLDTQAVEGANSMVKKMVQIAPNIKLPLLSDRLLVKKVLAPQVTQGETAEIRRQSRLDAIQYTVEKHKEAIQQILVSLC